MRFLKPRKDERGYILAVSNLTALFDQPTMAAMLLQDYGLEVFDGRDFSEFDQNQFRKLNKEPGINIKTDTEK